MLVVANLAHEDRRGETRGENDNATLGRVFCKAENMSSSPHPALSATSGDLQASGGDAGDMEVERASNRAPNVSGQGRTVQQGPATGIISKTPSYGPVPPHEGYQMLDCSWPRMPMGALQQPLAPTAGMWPADINGSAGPALDDGSKNLYEPSFAGMLYADAIARLVSEGCVPPMSNMSELLQFPGHYHAGAMPAPVVGLHLPQHLAQTGGDGSFAHGMVAAGPEGTTAARPYPMTGLAPSTMSEALHHPTMAATAAPATTVAPSRNVHGMDQALPSILRANAMRMISTVTQAGLLRPTPQAMPPLGHMAPTTAGHLATTSASVAQPASSSLLPNSHYNLADLSGSSSVAPLNASSSCGGAAVQANEQSGSLTALLGRKPKGPPRPLNSFIIYRMDKHAAVLKEHGEATPNVEVSKIISRMWREEDETVKQQYRLRAEHEKQLHQLKYPNYRYSPRRGRPRRVRNRHVAPPLESPPECDVASPASAPAETSVPPLPVPQAPYQGFPRSRSFEMPAFANANLPTRAIASAPASISCSPTELGLHLGNVTHPSNVCTCSNPPGGGTHRPHAHAASYRHHPVHRRHSTHGPAITLRHSAASAWAGRVAADGRLAHMNAAPVVPTSGAPPFYYRWPTHYVSSPADPSSAVDPRLHRPFSGGP